jgi:DNA-directed RNA polymerase specialized sigma24 family protein
VAAAPGPVGLFPQTRWTLVLAARDRPEERRRALGELLAPRWRALYVLARKHGLAPAEAEDAVQSFLARLIEGDLLAKLDPGRGRLRSYLRTAFAHHLINLHEHAAAAKRSGPLASLDELEALVASPAPSPEALFERAWALGLFEEALAALEAELAAGDRRGAEAEQGAQHRRRATPATGVARRRCCAPCSASAPASPTRS